MHSPVFGLNVNGLPGAVIMDEFSQHQRGGRIGRLVGHYGIYPL